jgi:hypothetical protein|tara:strand:+ start:1392 stop:1604 length:213 start_codon:yes stop_codon:yes gene_type:complete
MVAIRKTQLSNRIINNNDILYEILGSMLIVNADEEGTEIWKERWGADTLLRHDDMYYFCRKVIDVEFEDI